MKKKILIIVAIVVAVGICAAAAIWIINESKYVKPERIEPEVFEDVEFDSDLLIGLWNESSVYYRYNDDGSAVTWDVADDIAESEGTRLSWELRHNLFIHNYIMEIGGVVPKMYNMKQLELDILEYNDDYGVNHVFKRVEEPDLIN
ncbi:MAG: hypothetical protein MJZ90_09780 [Bacteroidales bacterium]|nr:hypothetical protein [Bacteroidales bacterium]